MKTFKRYLPLCATLILSVIIICVILASYFVDKDFDVTYTFNDDELLASASEDAKTTFNSMNWQVNMTLSNSISPVYVTANFKGNTLQNQVILDYRSELPPKTRKNINIGTKFYINNEQFICKKSDNENAIALYQIKTDAEIFVAEYNSKTSINLYENRFLIFSSYKEHEENHVFYDEIYAGTTLGVIYKGIPIANSSSTFAMTYNNGYIFVIHNKYIDDTGQKSNARVTAYKDNTCVMDIELNATALNLSVRSAYFTL